MKVTNGKGIADKSKEKKRASMTRNEMNKLSNDKNVINKML